MIRIENISKQNGRQIVFIEASAALQRGEKIGLVGPNGAGKPTLLGNAYRSWTKSGRIWRCLDAVNVGLAGAGVLLTAV